MKTNQPAFPDHNADRLSVNVFNLVNPLKWRMGAVLVMIFALGGLAMNGQAASIASLELGTTSFTGNTTGAATFTTKDANIASLPSLSLTSGQQGQAGGTGYVSSKTWNNTSQDTARYWTFTITASSGYNISVTSITIKGQRSGTGPTDVALRSDADSYAANLGTQSSLQNNSTTISFTGLTLANKSAITFRVYGWATSGGAAAGTWRIGDGAASSLDIDVQGTVAAAGFTVTYNGNGNTGGTAPTDGNSPYSSGSTVTVLGNTGSLTKTGNTFAGWNTAANGSGTSYAPGATFTIAANTTLYAQWTPVYTVTYNGNGNTGGSVPTDSNAYANGATVTVLANTGTLTKTGYTFAGWNTAANGSGTDYAATGSATFTMGSANVTLYAKWTINTYTVTYDGNGNTGGTAPVDGSSPYNYNTTVTVLGTGTLAKTGNTFAGWNTVANGSGTSYASGATFSITANTTLFAQWTSTPTISGAATASAFTTTYGTASSAQTFSVSGVNLTADITATAPSGFEASSDGTTYSGTATFTQSGGTASGTLYLRLKTNAVVGGSYNSQNIALSSTGASTVNITTSASGNSVTAKGLTITGLTGSNKVYDKTSAASFTGTPAYSGLTNGESFSVSGTPSAVFVSVAVSNGVPINITGYTAPSANYSLTQPTLSANITPLNLTITGVTVSNKVFNGSAAATLLTNGATLLTVISGDVVSVTGGGTFADTNVGTGIAVTAALTLAGADAGNYTLTQPTGLTGDITIASQTITFAALADKVSTNDPFTLTATASSGLAVSYASDNPSVATVSGSTVTIVGKGTTTITASQAGNGNYNPATDVARTLTVTDPVLAGWDINGNTGANALTPSTTGANLTVGSLTKGGGVTAGTAGNAWGGSGWNVASESAAISGGKFATATVKANTGSRVNFSAISKLLYRTSGTGPTNGAVQYSVDGSTYVDITNTLLYALNTTSGSVGAIDLSSISALQSVSSSKTVTFRIVNWGTANSAGTWYVNNGTTAGDDFVINGTVTTNRAPAATNLTLGVPVGGSASLLIIGGKNSPTDADGDDLTVSAVTQGANGTVSFTGTNVTYTSTSAAASDSFTYTVSDGAGGTATGTVNVTLSSSGSFNQLAATPIEGGALRFTYLGIPGTNYCLEVTHSLSGQVTWEPLQTNAASGTGAIVFTNTPSLTPTNDFYRTVYVP